jgi:anaerobic ribonucleoside-triphosphate reductase activating protein
MYVYDFQIVLQEVPGEISLCFSISGCKLKCKGCHSPFLWKEGVGEILAFETYIKLLEKYKKYATCVLFMGGEWHPKILEKLLLKATMEGYKTCLYTGETYISNNIKQHLNWLKTGKWIKTLGGLESTKTNQKFIDVKNNKQLNYLFIKN